MNCKDRKSAVGSLFKKLFGNIENCLDESRGDIWNAHFAGSTLWIQSLSNLSMHPTFLSEYMQFK